MENNIVNFDTENEIKEDIDDAFENRCGIFKWRPIFLQRFRSIYMFLVATCFVCIVQTALSSGYMSSQITTLERRFSLDSSMLGMIQSFFDVGFIFSVIIVGFFGGQGRIPRWIGFGMLIMSVGAFSFSLPQFMSSYQFNPTQDIHDSEICRNNNKSRSFVTKCNTENKANWLVKLVFIIGQVLIGSGSSPILSLSPTYIDDHVHPTIAPPLIALLYASSALGPVIGFGLGALMLQYPDSGNTVKGSKPGDSNWIGAWWGGYLLLGILAVVMAFVLFMFPRRVRKITKTKRQHSKTLTNDHTDAAKIKWNIPPKADLLMDNDLRDDDFQDILNLPSEISTYSSEPSVQETNELDAMEYGKDIRDIPRAMWSLLSNKIFLVVSLAQCCEVFLLNGFAAFLPKYIETEYKVSNITSSLIAGGLIVPAGALGIITGGLIMQRFQLSRRKAVLFSIGSVLLVLGCMALFFMFGCKNPLFAGINTDIYFRNKKYLSIDNACNNETCFNKCDSNTFSPLCDELTGVIFFSACYAGCRKFVIDSADKNRQRPISFYNCSCTSISEKKIGSTVLKDGECAMMCNSLTSFVLFLTLALFLTGVCQNPLLMVTIRSVQKHERSFGLGFQFVILRLLAYIPSPIIYGSVIDASCVHWKYICGERGDCLVTNLQTLNLYLIGLSFLVKCGAIVFYVLLYFIVPKHVSQHGREDNANNYGRRQSSL